MYTGNISILIVKEAYQNNNKQTNKMMWGDLNQLSIYRRPNEGNKI